MVKQTFFATLVFFAVHVVFICLQSQGQNPLSDEIRPVVVIRDMNNEPPRFEGLDPSLSNAYKGSVPENEQTIQTVINVKAVDADHDPPNNVVSTRSFK
jgi:hypothetical protein